ncbi:hypothetical protein Adt_41472 [Abeliophyllum distichum]|uniref:Uncharacterized protein n=1 Tax=Abeliophyllum distichum TaxID=126358 RepID=A0ABD1PNX9_9LAMI
MLRRGRKSRGESKAAWPYGGGRIPPFRENLPSRGRRKNFQETDVGSDLPCRGVDRLESLEEQDCARSVHMCWRTLHQQQLVSMGWLISDNQSVWDGLSTITRPKATASCSGVAVISEYCKGNSSAVEYPLELKLIGLHIEDVSFATDQTERHLEVGNTGYGNYDSSAKRRLLVSLGIFLRSYYKGGMLGEQSASLPRASVLTEGSLWASLVH